MTMPSSTTVVTTSPTSPRPHTCGGSLSLTSRIKSSTEENSTLDPFIFTGENTEDPHAFHPPSTSASRLPCPALNTLSNHGYLPRDGHNITVEDLIAALTHPDTYNLSIPLANVLARGGFGLAHEAQSKAISLHDLARHNQIEHDASVVHKNAAKGAEYAPTRADTVLLDEFLENKEFVTLDDIAKRRVELERASKLDLIHAEIARGEWALVLDIFGRSHGGKVPADFLRVWLGDNRFPEGWKPTHEQGLRKTVAKSAAIHWDMEMHRLFHKMGARGEARVEQLTKQLMTTPLEAESSREEL